MISERQLARGFQELWGEVLPTLTPHFVHLFNQAYGEELGGGTGAVPIRPNNDHSLVAEFAFHVARLAHERGVGFQNIADNNGLLSDAELAAVSLIAQYEEGRRDSPASVNESERREGLLLVRNYEFLLSKYAAQDIEFGTRIPGSGFVNACTADLSLGDALFEVKTVERNLASKDLRQLLVYLALQSATGEKRWTRAGFFNPRRGLVYEFSLESTIPLMSGGRLTSEVFQEMLRFFGTRDIQLDWAF